jgi:hypothetical protein
MAALRERLLEAAQGHIDPEADVKPMAVQWLDQKGRSREIRRGVAKGGIAGVTDN